MHDKDSDYSNTTSSGISNGISSGRGSDNTKLDYCFDSLDKTSDVAVDFKIVPGYVSTPGHFNHETDQHRFKPNACPVETILHACSLGNPTKASDVLAWKYVATSKCHLERFSPLDFLDRIRGRHVVFVGDSMSLQLWQIVVCSLHGVTKIEYDIKWFDYIAYYIPDPHGRWPYHTCPFGVEHCYIEHATVSYPLFNASFSIQTTHFGKRHGEQLLQEFIDPFKLGRNDVILFNFGLHFNDMKLYERLLTNFTIDYANTKKRLGKDMPLVIWRETSAQHFANGGPAGYYKGGNRVHCKNNSTKDLFYEHDVRNRVMDNVIALVIPIMRLVNSTYMETSSHIDVALMSPYTTDCTHYCLPSSPLYIFRDLLYNLFRTLITEKKDGE